MHDDQTSFHAANGPVRMLKDARLKDLNVRGFAADRVIVDEASEIRHGSDASLGPDPKPMNWSANLAKEARAVIQPDLHAFALPVIEPPKLAIPTHWSFRDKDVAAGFDDHVREQLPWYDLVTGAVAQVARHYITEHGRVVDLGCSTGNVGRALAKDLDERNATLTGVDEASEMIELYRGPGEVVTSTIEDYVENADHRGVDVVTCFLSLMFIDPGNLARAIDQIMHYVLRPGGAMIVVDRLQPDHGYPGLVKTRLTLAGKLAAGASAAEILHKELSLAGVQRPLPVDLFDEYGPVEFFRFADFTGLLIERPLT